MANDNIQEGETRGRARSPGKSLFQKLTISLTGPLFCHHQECICIQGYICMN